MTVKRTTIALEEKYFNLLLQTAGKLQINLKQNVSLGSLFTALLKLVDNGKITMTDLERIMKK